MRILVCGDRHWGEHVEDDRLVTEAVARVAHQHPDAVIVHGDCRGADRMAATIAHDRFGLTVEPHPADWATYGRAAGPIRNKEMLDSGIDMVIAFHRSLDSSKGTKNMIAKALDADVRVVLVPVPGTSMIGGLLTLA